MNQAENAARFAVTLPFRSFGRVNRYGRFVDFAVRDRDNCRMANARRTLKSKKPSKSGNTGFSAVP